MSLISADEAYRQVKDYPTLRMKQIMDKCLTYINRLIQVAIHQNKYQWTVNFHPLNVYV